jgi:hypothetical protein
MVPQWHVLWQAEASTTMDMYAWQQPIHPVAYPQKVQMHVHGDPSCTYVRAVRLPSVDGMLPDSWLTAKFSQLQNTSSSSAQYC